ncbi:L-seryl-tRNA(Sec) selenium transferase [Isachenkonia alkalipeptolytica]|uniref:L-seryl-tRNA(Sec) selenium transferase n=1 Tax=Isachenkonia alkalipeptolytica TaxID=2565777 RepID=A0AA44BEF3_9CLOT|nr:L-seryl-tRNA(Sec) selenium transferase [Isachenkonia alkalipeptolytica]NBG88932.1 L-seryl-tRNA(Sec) selenium transferase [Isachenkonia alkalipeptolytica]
MNKNQLLREIPSVDRLLQKEETLIFIRKSSVELVTHLLRRIIEEYRKKVLADQKGQMHPLSEEQIITKLEKEMSQFIEMNLKQVINGTGTVLHTNLGRALFSEEMKEEVWKVLSNYSNLELDLSTGKRGSRYSHLVEKIKFITGAEDALVVNNNAAAVLLTLSSIAKGKEVIVSRGELVEIGGAFRIPDVMEQSGATLVDVGTTNKTHLRDYESNVTEETGALLKVHTSNYKIMGFTKEVPLKELVDFGKGKSLPVIEDLGSGVLIDLEKYGLAHEPTVQESVKAGADIITFSGDKLLGGPQAGIIIGKREWIDKMKKNPLTRAFRIDKMTVSSLEMILSYYLREETVVNKIPGLSMITMPYERLVEKAEKLKQIIGKKNEGLFTLSTREDYSQVGGGSLPLEQLKTEVVIIEFHKTPISSVEKALREASIPIIPRVSNDAMILDPRTINERDFDYIATTIQRIVKEKH